MNLTATFQKLNDPDADARSPMMRQKCVCNGEKPVPAGMPGHQLDSAGGLGKACSELVGQNLECEHYWFQIIRFATANSATFKLGDRVRRCMLEKQAWDLQQRLEFIDLPTRCNQYRPSLRQYDPDSEKYDPITPEEADFLQGEWEKRREDETAMAAFAPDVMLEDFRAEMKAKVAAGEVPAPAPDEMKPDEEKNG